jgi:type II secretory pathway pseudopilin PulG
MRNNQKALTILEILVASVILAITAAGLSGVFVSGKKYVHHARMRMVGGELGSAFIDPLQAAVRQGSSGVSAQDGWGQVNNPLSTTSSLYCDGISAHTQSVFCPSASQRSLSNTVYSAQYNISALGSARKVATTIKWTEAD